VISARGAGAWLARGPTAGPGDARRDRAGTSLGALRATVADRGMAAATAPWQGPAAPLLPRTVRDDHADLDLP
jgi:hypothetical protein